MKSGYLVCYDIADPRRLNKVCNLLKGRGIHLQYSVFYCKLTWSDLLKLKEEVNLFIKDDEDDVRFYPLPSDGKVTVMGKGDRIPEGAALFLH